MLPMVAYSRRPPRGHFMCYLNRTYHVLTTPCGSPVDTRPECFIMLAVMLPMRSVVIALLSVVVVPSVTARLDITQRQGDIWLEIPELHSRVEGNGSVVLEVPPTSISHLVVHIAAQPQDARYGDIHTVINTEAADPITNKNSTDEGIVCDLDLTHWGQ